MSLPVDRDLRRAEVVDAALGIVADAGLDGLTVRAVARARGCSTAVVSHYFAGKRDLLVAVYRHTTDMTFSHWTRAEAAGGDLRACLASALPLDAERLRLWRVNFAFWSVAALDADLAGIQSDLLARASDNIGRALAHDAVAGGLPEARRRQLGRQILSLVMGIATQASLGQPHWLPQRQTADLFDALAHLLGEQR
ncbi:MAG: hypothetical protein RIS94_192 [Pseudomonadota bacterium]|jgi:AcrR family transcriptional regulator